MVRQIRRSVLAALLTLGFILGQGTWALAGTTGTLSGNVTNGSTRAPIAGAKVTAQSASQTATTTTDASGHFVFLALSPDTYNVTIEKSGFEPQQQQGITVLADQNQVLSFASRPTLQVIGRTTSRSVTDLVKPGTTSDVYSVTAEQQEKFSGVGGGGGLNNAYSAIATVPGAFVPPNQAGYYQTVNIRGGDYDQVGYELDGIPVNRSFDNYPSGTASSLGQQELQVYTGANPANSEGQGLAGYINQVIRTGTYPGFGNLDLGAGAPTFYHKASAEVGGATPDRNFSYYVGLGGYNQDFRYYDQFNGASLTPRFGVPLADCDGTNAGNGIGANATAATVPSCFVNGQPVVNYGAPSGYVLGPYQFDNLSNISERDSVVNLHVGLPRRNGLRDDIQALYVNNYLLNDYYSSTNDQGGADFLNLTGTGVPTYADAYQSNIPLGTLFQANIPTSSVSQYFYPSSISRPFGSTIPANDRDSTINDQAIAKLQYTHAFSQNALLKLYGYTYYSDWLQHGPQSSYANYGGNASPDYELESHTRGLSATFTAQLNSQHLLSAQASYTTANTLRDNNTQMFNTGGTRSRAFPIVDANNPFAGTCYYLSKAGPVASSCAPNNPGSVRSTFGTFAQVYNGTLRPLTGLTCGTGPCTYLAAENGLYATYNTVKPTFTAFSLTDQWKPTAKLDINLGLRLDDYQFQGADTQPNSPTRQFWYNAYNASTCVNTATGVPIDKNRLGGARVSPATPCSTFNTPAATYVSTAAAPAGPLVNASGETTNFSILQPRIGLTYSVDPTTVLRASYGRYVQAPNAAFEQYNTLQQDFPYTFGGPRFYKYGFTTPTHNIRPPTSNNYDLSVEHAFRGTDVSVKLTPFLRKTQDQLQQLYLDQQTSFVSGLNVGRQTSSGFEFELDKGRFDRNGLAGKLSFTYTNSYVQYSKLPNGTDIFSVINGDIANFNAYTKGCAANPGQNQYGKALCGSTSTGVAAAPCYTAAGAPDPACAAGSIANPYWNYPVQPLFDANGKYAPYDVFPQGPETSAASFGAPYFATLIVNYKHNKLAITPSLQFVAGALYGAPETYVGVAPEACTAGLAGGSAAKDPRYQYGAPGGLAYDASTCGGPALAAIPDPYTRNFDTLGAFRQPSNLLAHLQVRYDMTDRVQLTANFTNLINSCFGGTQNPGVAWVGNACGYGIVGIGGYAGGGAAPSNSFNPGDPVQPILAHPYQPFFRSFPFNAYFNVRLKI